jgi:hypothetical protein
MSFIEIVLATMVGNIIFVFLNEGLKKLNTTKKS